jgi:hypothetical protein
MGQLVFIYRKTGQELSDAISDTADALVVVNIPGPFEPSEEAPAFRLIDAYKGFPALIPVAPPPDGYRGPMAGGNYAGANHSDWIDAVIAITGGAAKGEVLVSIHDHFEWAGAL